MRLALLLAPLLVALPTSGQETPMARFTASRAAAAAGQQEADAGRWETAVPHVEAAVAARPGQVAYRLLLARAYAETGRDADARASLDTLAAQGVVLPADGLGPALDRLDADGALRTAFDANGRRTGVAAEAATWADPTFGPEGIAVDGGRLFVSSMRRGQVVAVEDGQANTFAVLFGTTLRGLAADPAQRRLWAGVAPGDGASGGLAAFDLDTGAALTAVIPVDSAGSAVGDLTVGPGGAVYASAASGAVVRLDPDTEAVETLVAPGVLPSPQGLALVDGALVVADYATGLHRLDLETGALTPLAAPRTATLLGIDGLVGRGRTLYAVQNGVRPYRVLRLRLDGDRLGVDVLLAGDARLGEPTQAALAGAGLLVVANAVWPLLDDGGALDPAAAQPPLVLRVPLDER